MGKKYKGVKKASESSIEISFIYRGNRCRERIKLKPTPANLKAAEAHRYAILDSIAKGTFDYCVTFPDSKNGLKYATNVGQTIYMKQQLNEWLNTAQQTLKASTYRDYRNMVLNQLVPAFGHLRLSELNVTHVKLWAKSLGVSNKRVSNLIGPLRQCVAEAHEDGLIESNPLYGWSFKNRLAPKSDYEIDPLDMNEQIALLDCLSGQSRNQVQFALWTGLRTSELIALTWNDVDLHNGYIRISKALTQAATKTEATKTKSGMRDVKLLKMAREALVDQKKYTFMAGGPVFVDPRYNKRWTGDQAVRKSLWMPAIRKSGLRYRNPYQTRHTYASMMLTAGEDPIWVAQQMGHKDWSMISKVYGKWIPNARPDAGDKVEKLFTPNDNIKTANKNEGT